MQRIFLGLVLLTLLACSDSTSSGSLSSDNSAGSAGASSSDTDCGTLEDKIRNTAAKDQALIDQGRSSNPCAEPIVKGDAGDYAKDCNNLTACLKAHPEETACDALQEKIKNKAAKDQGLILKGRDKDPCAEPIATGDAGDYTKDCSDLNACLAKTK